MKIKQMNIALGLLLLFMNIIGCNDSTENTKDTQAPGCVTNVSFTPTYGGGYFLYTLPSDADFLFLRADYKLDNGVTVSKSSSVYSDTLFIEGLGQEKEYVVQLYSVDRDNNISKPVEQRIIPLSSNTKQVLQTVKVLPGFSSVIINWENKLEQVIDVCVEIKIGDKKALKVVSSNLLKDRFVIDGLEGKPHTITGYIKDGYGNKSEVKDFGSLTPFYDGKLSKDKWSFLRNDLLYGNKWDYASHTDPTQQTPFDEYKGTFSSDSLKNAKESHVEGRIQKFWDDEYDSGAKKNLNYFHTGSQVYPFSYFIDMGRTIRGSRFAVWQRDTDPYRGDNVIVCELWISNDQNPADGIDNWELLGKYKIIKPSDPLMARNEVIEGHHFDIYPEEPKFTKPFRYLRYKAIEHGGDNNIGCMSEITLYGEEAAASDL